MVVFYFKYNPIEDPSETERSAVRRKNSVEGTLGKQDCDPCVRMNCLQSEFISSIIPIQLKKQGSL